MKIYSVILGADGVGFLSQALNFNNLVCFIGTVGIPLGLTKYISAWKAENKMANVYVVMNQTIALMVLLSCFMGLITLLFSDQLSSLLFESTKYSYFFILISVSFPFAFLSSVFEAFLKGLKEFNMFVVTSSLAAIISLIISTILVLYQNVFGAVVALFLSSVTSLLIYLIGINKHKLYNFNIKKIAIFSYEFKKVLLIGFSSLLVGLSDQFVLLLLRTYIVKTYGFSSNGIYQSIATISNNYFSLFYLSISTYALPVLSEMKQTYEINLEINTILKFTLFLTVPIIALTFVCRELVIQIFFTKNFLAASDYLLFNFIGDFFKALTWVLGAWLLPGSKIKLWLVIGVLYNAIYFVSFYILLNAGLGLYSIVIAYSIANFIVCVINYYYITKLNSFKFVPENIKLLLLSVLALFIILTASQFNITIGYIAILPLLFFWIYFSLSKSDFNKAVVFLKSYSKLK